MTAALLAVLAATGVHLLFSSAVLGRRTLRGPALSSRERTTARRDALRAELGLQGDRARRALGTSGVAAGAGLLGSWLIVGGVLAPIVGAGLASLIPIGAARSAHLRRRAAAMDAWPRLLEELRVLAGSVGRSIPQALIEVGRRAPVEMQAAFTAAEREWLLSTDFDRTLSALKHGLTDPTTDMIAETLLVAHEVGGTDLDRRLHALIEDRTQDLHARKDARARQAGARYARWFVLAVPVGMALVGMSLGTGRSAYQTASGQLLSALAIVTVAACWLWAGRIMTLPEERRVFDA